MASASKAFNLAGLKCAVMVTAGERPDRDRARDAGRGRVAHVAVRDARERGGPLARERRLARRAARDARSRIAGCSATCSTEHLPGARYLAPDAGYLAWVDLTALGWGRNPAKRILRDAKVAFHFGPAFGEEGDGHVRINFGCSPEVLREAMARVGALVDS